MFHENEWHGHGSLKWSNGASYTGTFIAGKVTGEGEKVFKYSLMAILIGEW